MFSRKLRAIGYNGDFPLILEGTVAVASPQCDDYLTMNPTNLDPSQLRDLCYWIEQTKLKRLMNEPEICHRIFHSAEEVWPQQLEEYLRIIGCPWTVADRPAMVDWLLRQCVAMDHAGIDCTFKLSGDFKRVMILKGDSTKGTVLENDEEPVRSCLENIDPDSKDLCDGVLALTRILNIQPHENVKLTLRAIAQVLDNLSQQDISESTDTRRHDMTTIFPLDSLPLGLSVEDPVLSKAMKIVRLLHIGHLRELQTRFDEALVALQHITANPKTDQALGRIGI